MTEAAAVKHKVSTDALETLGSVIDEHQKRDAIHIAVEPARAVEYLERGDHVGFTGGGMGKLVRSQCVGIVDPFLDETVAPGEYFWLLVYPRQITSLRHVWSHPKFLEAEVYAEPQKTDEDRLKQESEKWLRNFCESIDTSLSFVEIMEGVDQSGDSKYGLCYGEDICGSIPNEFWDHAERYLGKKFPVRPEYFRCAC